MKRLNAALVAGLAGSGLLLSGTAAGAGTTKGDPHAGPDSIGSPISLPAGYTVVVSTAILSPNGTQTFGSVACPGTKQPSSGGALVASSSLAANINSSYPNGNTWEVYVNNTSGADTTFTVFAVCLAHSASYTIASVSGVTRLGESEGVIDCPVHSFVIGGGVVSMTSSTAVNIDTSTPFGPGARTGWEVFMSSTQSTATSFTVYAICHSKPKGWSVQTGNGVSIPPGTEAKDTVTCPGASVPIGGGGFTQFNSAATTIDMNSTYPSNNTWVVYENNNQATAITVKASAVCAGT